MNWGRASSSRKATLSRPRPRTRSMRSGGGSGARLTAPGVVSGETVMRHLLSVPMPGAGSQVRRRHESTHMLRENETDQRYNCAPRASGGEGRAAAEVRARSLMSPRVRFESRFRRGRDSSRRFESVSALPAFLAERESLPNPAESIQRLRPAPIHYARANEKEEPMSVRRLEHIP